MRGLPKGDTMPAVYPQTQSARALAHYKNASVLRRVLRLRLESGTRSTENWALSTGIEYPLALPATALYKTGPLRA